MFGYYIGMSQKAISVELSVLHFQKINKIEGSPMEQESQKRETALEMCFE